MYVHMRWASSLPSCALAYRPGACTAGSTGTSETNRPSIGDSGTARGPHLDRLADGELVHGYFRAASAASARTSSASSSCSSVITSGGRWRSTLWYTPQETVIRPALLGLGHQRPTIRRRPAPSSHGRPPSRRRPSNRGHGCRRLRDVADGPPTARGSTCRRPRRARSVPPSSITSRTATAAAQATGFPTYVPPIAEGPGASMISVRPTTAESG